MVQTYSCHLEHFQPLEGFIRCRSLKSIGCIDGPKLIHVQESKACRFLQVTDYDPVYVEGRANDFHPGSVSLPSYRFAHQKHVREQITHGFCLK